MPSMAFRKALGEVDSCLSSDLAGLSLSIEWPLALSLSISLSLEKISFSFSFSLLFVDGLEVADAPDAVDVDAVVVDAVAAVPFVAFLRL